MFVEWLVGGSLLPQNIYEVITYSTLFITYSTLYYPSKAYSENKWYIIIVEDNNFLIHIVS